jgi:hypothetical protein
MSVRALIVTVLLAAALPALCGGPGRLDRFREE